MNALQLLNAFSSLSQLPVPGYCCLSSVGDVDTNGGNCDTSIINDLGCGSDFHKLRDLAAFFFPPTFVVVNSFSF